MNIEDKLYFPYDDFVQTDVEAHPICGYWLSSPMAGNKNFPGMLDVRRFGPDGMMINYDIAFRPVVCLQSNVRFILDESGEVYDLSL